MKKVLVITGTRPEVIKMWPVILELKKEPTIATFLVHTGQHDEMASQMFDTFEIHPDYTFKIIRQDSDFGFSELSQVLLKNLTPLLRMLKPDLVLCHGDTLSGCMGAWAAYLEKIPVGHVEAGLRTSRYERPWIEEGNRRIIGQLAVLHFAPTRTAALNLQQAAVPGKIFITGNTIVDGVQQTLKAFPQPEAVDSILSGVRNKLVLVTCHRHENFGRLPAICEAIRKICNTVSCTVVVPVHPNPLVKAEIYKQLSQHSSVLLVDPLSYPVFLYLLKKADLVVTDSGGVVEECVVFGKMVLVLREEFERVDALALDNVVLTGYDFENLVTVAVKQLTRPQKFSCSNIFGDGTAAQQIVEWILKHFNEKTEVRS